MKIKDVASGKYEHNSKEQTRIRDAVLALNKEIEQEYHAFILSEKRNALEIAAANQIKEGWNDIYMYVMGAIEKESEYRENLLAKLGRGTAHLVLGGLAVALLVIAALIFLRK